jgi:lipid-binding SYLF domain-containing protein
MTAPKPSPEALLPAYPRFPTLLRQATTICVIFVSQEISMQILSTGLRTSGLVILAVTLAAFSSLANAKSATEIDAEVDASLKLFKEKVGSADELLAKSNGVLVFPSVIKAGIGIGGEYGEGALRIGGKTADYYSTAAASIGLQLGAQAKTVIILFLEQAALDKFRTSKGWEAGVDGSVALIQVGAGGSIDTTNIKDPIVGFVIGQKGLMFNVTLEGSKFTKLVRE